MRNSSYAIILSLVIGLMGCAQDENKKSEEAAKASAPKVTKPEEAHDGMAKKDPAPRQNVALPGLSALDKARLDQTVSSSFGKGSFENKQGHTYTFTLEGSMLKDNTSHGRFRFYSFQGDGKLDVKGEMTCVHINSPDRQIWMAGRITENASTVDAFKQGKYANGGFVSFRARPNALNDDGVKPGAIETPEFVTEAQASKFCQEKVWSDSALIELGENDLIAAIP